MPAYRAYVLGDDQHLAWVPPTIITARDDADAIEQAKKLVDGHDIEVWDGPRQVARLESRDKR